MQLGQPTQCTNLINDKLFRHEAASVSLVPCQTFCEQVITRCVGRSNLEQLNESWKAYVMSLAELAKKLSVQYNIETIIAPLDVQISEAIMNFQDNAQNISHQVFQACGRATVNSGPLGSGGGGGSGSGSGLSMGSSSASLGHHQSHQSSGQLSALVKPAAAVSQLAAPNRLGKRAAPAPMGPVAVLQQRSRNGLHPSHQSAASGNGLDSSGAGHSRSLQPHSQLRTSKNFASSSSAAGYSGLSLDEVSSLNGSPAGFLGSGSGSGGSSASSLLGLAANPLLASPKRRPIVIDEIRDYMLSTKLFWANLPNSVCTNNGSATSTMILNTGGVSVSQQQQPMVLSKKAPHCFQEQLGLSDMNSDLRYRIEIQHQVKRLNFVQSRINDALQGVEIDWTTSGQTPNGNSVPTSGQQSPTLNTAHSSSSAPISSLGAANHQKGPTSGSAASGVYQQGASLASGPTTQGSLAAGEDEPEEEDDNVEGSGDDSHLSSSSKAGDSSGSPNGSPNTDDGTTPDESDYPDDNDDPEIEPIANNDDDYSTGSSSPNNDSDDPTTQQPSAPNADNEQNPSSTQENSLDSTTLEQPKVPINLDISNDLITAPDAQKSNSRGHHQTMKLANNVMFNLVNVLFLFSTLSLTLDSISR